MYSRTIAMMFLMVGFWSCNSDDETNCPEDFTGSLGTGEEVLVGKWQLKAIKAEEALDLTDDDTDNPSKDLFAQYSACQKDAFYTFETDRTYAYEQGKTAEDCENTFSSDGTWRFASNTLNLVSSCSVQSTGLELNEDFTEFTFSVDYKISEVDGSVVQTTLDFTYALLDE
ncbi:DUF5004 domain-containing protein [Flagellimonas oceani]|nr:DUF5004 domain-containing protein [Allomuricauda oceani]